MKVLVAILISAVSLFPLLVKAEGGCPPGQYPQQGQGWKTCVPIPGYQQEAQPPETPQPQWRSNWQALATDNSKGVLGTASNQPDRQSAEQQAIASCIRNGGADCKLQASVGNGCISMVVGEKSMFFDSAPAQAQATSRATASCREENASCKVYYEACNAASRTD